MITEPPLRALLAADHIDHHGAMHGAGRQLIELAKAFDPSHVEPTVCVLHPPSELGRGLQSEGLPLRFLGIRSSNPAAVIKLVRLIRQKRIDVLHVTDFGASTYGRIAGRLTGTPVIVHVRSHHSVHQPRGFPRRVEFAYRVMAPFTAKVIAISNSVRDFAIRRMGFRPEQVVVLNNPLAEFSFPTPPEGEVASLRQSYSLGENDPVVGTVTRFHAAKGIRFLIEAFPAVLRDLPTAWLVLVGDGPQKHMLRAKAEELGIAERVVFAGFQRDVQTYFRMFDLSVVPSLEEGFGNVAVESLAVGVPVVASRLGGLPEIITDGETGFLVEAANPNAIAQAILRILQNSDLRAQMSSAARRVSKRFSMDRYIVRLEELYQTTVAGQTASDAETGL